MSDRLTELFQNGEIDENQIIGLLGALKDKKDMLRKAGIKLAGKPPGTRHSQPDFVEIEEDKVTELAMSNKIIKEIEGKPKRELTEAQKAGLEKGRQALMERYRKMKEEREANKTKYNKAESDDVVRIKSLVKDPSKKTILIKVKGKPVKKVKPVEKFEKVEKKKIQKEESSDEEEETTEYTQTETETESEPEPPKSIRKIQKKVQALRKVEEEIKKVAPTSNPVNAANPYSKFLKW